MCHIGYIAQVEYVPRSFGYILDKNQVLCLFFEKLELREMSHKQCFY